MNLFSAVVRGALASASLVAMASMLAATPVASARHFQVKADAQPAGATPAAAPTAVDAPAGDKPDFTQEELEQMIAPIALYPDSLLSQVFMASTYPIEVVEADRWAKANASLKGDDLAKALEKQTWDPSVRSLVNFPQVLAMMSENLSTTVKIGDAFIGQQKAVMDTVQKLRAKAQSTGNLKSTPEQVVKVEQAPAGSTTTQVIVIEPAKPDVIYVPTYSPTVVYGTWPYPAYPPYPYYPPGYVASNVLSFGLGVACGVAWGYAWGNCNWGRGDVNINYNQNNNFNNRINHNNFQKNNVGQGGSWKHDPSHRQGASYRNQGAANRAGATTTNRAATQARNDYRGKADAGRSDINRGGADGFKGNSPSAGNRANTNAGAGAGAANRANNPGAANRPANTAGTNKGSAFSGAGNSGATARADSNRGASSRSASPSSRSAPARSSGGGASRGGGGGGRGGGGRR